MRVEVPGIGLCKAEADPPNYFGWLGGTAEAVPCYKPECKGVDRETARAEQAAEKVGKADPSSA